VRLADATLIAVALAACAPTPGGVLPEPATPEFAEVNGLRLAYESYGTGDGDAILLLGGTGTQLIDWPRELIDELVDRGFRVIAFDSRDVGLSTKLDSLGLPDWEAVIRALQQGRPPPLPYSLDDMADDAVGLLDALGIQRAHLVGVSQGGIIAQRAAIRYPDRVRALTLFMSGSGNPQHPVPAQPERLAEVDEPPADTSFDALVDYQMSVARAFAGRDYPPDEAELRRKVEQAVQRGYHQEGLFRHQAAALAASYQDRREALGRVGAPTVVVQGDDDPLVPVASVREVAESIPGAEFVLVPGMGHDLPEELAEMFAGLIASAEEGA
jgi:pimeloyl-ACP methyl ester carboxylesterase